MKKKVDENNIYDLPERFSDISFYLDKIDTYIGDHAYRKSDNAVIVVIRRDFGSEAVVSFLHDDKGKLIRIVFHDDGKDITGVLAGRFNSRIYKMLDAIVLYADSKEVARRVEKFREWVRKEEKKREMESEAQAFAERARKLGLVQDGKSWIHPGDKQ